MTPEDYRFSGDLNDSGPGHSPLWKRSVDEASQPAARAAAGADLVLSMMVLSRWAMVSTVQSVNSARMVAWIRSSVSRSTAAVASSSTSSLVFRSRARPRQINCRWPTLDTAQVRSGQQGPAQTDQLPLTHTGHNTTQVRSVQQSAAQTDQLPLAHTGHNTTQHNTGQVSSAERGPDRSNATDPSWTIVHNTEQTISDHVSGPSRVKSTSMKA